MRRREEEERWVRQAAQESSEEKPGQDRKEETQDHSGLQEVQGRRARRDGC